MKPSSFQTTIENQFDYICKSAMDNERKSYVSKYSWLEIHKAKLNWKFLVIYKSHTAYYNSIVTESVTKMIWTS